MDSSININQNNFDFIRLVLAFTVMGHHICVLVPGDVYSSYHFLFQDYIAIRVFFIISGFLIAKSLSSSSSLKNYFIKRVRRIVPAYTFVILLFAVLLSFFSYLSFQEYFTSKQFWYYLGVNLIYQNYLEPCLPGVFLSPNTICTVNASLWTIKIEEGFYLLLPLLVFIQQKLFRKKWFFYGLIYLCSIIFSNVLTNLGYHRIAKQLPGTLCYFVAGILCFHYFNWLKSKLKYFVLPALLVFLLEYNLSIFLLFGPFAMAIVALFVAYNFKFLNHFGKHGDFTYGVYIFHFPITQMLISKGFHNVVGKWEFFCIVVMISFVCAFFSWKYIESRFISRTFVNRIKSLDV